MQSWAPNTKHECMHTMGTYIGKKVNSNETCIKLNNYCHTEIISKSFSRKFNGWFKLNEIQTKCDSAHI